MSSQQSGKVCSKCGVDVSGKPRTKDAQGKYLCASCAKGGVAPAPAKTSKPAKPATGLAGEFEDNSFLLNVGSKPASFAECPGCQRPVPEGAKICTMCGYDIANGRVLKTRLGTDKIAKDKK